MSRVGKNPVVIPEGTDVNIMDQIVSAKGKVGELSVSLPREVEITQEQNSPRNISSLFYQPHSKT